MNLTIFSKRGWYDLFSLPCCGAKFIVEKLAKRYNFQYTVVNIDSDKNLKNLYSAKIPVISIDGHEVASLKINERNLREIIHNKMNLQ